MAFRELPLRILYNINDSPQLILAKGAKQPVTVPDTPHLSDSEAAKYASIAARTCLHFVKKFSPELFSPGKDYSVYCLDPLENFGTAMPNQSMGIAVGLGLMSEIRQEEKDHMMATGIVQKMPNGQEGLQIVFNFRESNAQSTLNTTGGPVMNSGADFVEPPAKKRAQKSRAQSPNTSASTSTVLPPQTMQTSAPPSILELLAGLSSASINSGNAPHHAALLATLSSIDSAPRGKTPPPGGSTSSTVTPTSPPHPKLVEAIRDYISNSNPQPSPQASTSEPGPSQQQIASNSRGEKISVDKENLSPRQICGKEKNTEAPAPLLAADTPPAPLVSQSESSASGSNECDTPLRADASLSQPRKRKLDDVFNPSGNAANVETKKNPPVFRFLQNSCPTSKPPSDSLPCSSPPKQSSRQRSKSKHPASSPVSKPPRYKLPSWAQTTTTTKPRFSSEVAEAIEAEETRKQEEKDERTRQRRERDKNNKRRVGFERSMTTTREESAEASSSSTFARSKSVPSMPHAPAEVALPVAASSGPVIASDSNSNLDLDDMGQGTRSASPPPPSKVLPPSTPPRKRRATFSTPGLGDSSLFTPTPRSGGPVSLFGQSPLFSPSSPVRKRTKVASPSPSSGPKIPTVAEDDRERNWLASGLSSGLPSCEPDDDMELPPSSLPLASSPTPPPAPLPGEDEDETADLDSSMPSSPVREHWHGLPPSSPIPSSPMTQPSDDFDFGRDAFMTDDESSADPFSEATSEVEGVDAPPSEVDPHSCSAEDFAKYFGMSDDEVNAVLNNTTNTGLSPDFFNFSLDGGNGNNDLDAAMQNGLGEFDYSEFWNSIQPLMAEGETQNALAGVDFTNESSGLIGQKPLFGEGISDSNLDQEIQSLFSGCLV